MKHILITGASTGIGEATARALAAEGYSVLAGVRRPEDGERLRSTNIRPIRIDVADAESVRTAMAEVAGIVGEEGLFALLNNAGINLCGPFELTKEEELQRIINVNLMGVYRTSRAALSLLQAYRKKTGERARLLATASIGGAIGFPWEWSYHATKFAVVGMCQSLRFELAPLGIDVTAIMPGGVQTPLFAKSHNSLAESLTGADTPNLPYYQKNTATFQQAADMMYKMGLKPEQAARQIVGALRGRRSPARVLVGRDARLLNGLVRLLPTRWVHGLLQGQMAKE